MPSPLPRSEQDGSGYQTIEEHEERAETETADAPHCGDKAKQYDGGMPHILRKPTYGNRHYGCNEDQGVENGKEIVTYATHHTQKITQGNKEKRAPCCLQCALACGSEGWHTPPQAESKRKQRQDDKGNAVLPATLFGTERFHSSGHRMGFKVCGDSCLCLKIRECAKGARHLLRGAGAMLLILCFKPGALRWLRH